MWRHRKTTTEDARGLVVKACETATVAGKVEQSVVAFVYGPFQQLDEVVRGDGSGKVYARNLYTRDSLGRVTRNEEADAGETRVWYNAFGGVRQMQDAEGKQIVYERDPLGRGGPRL